MGRLRLACISDRTAVSRPSVCVYGTVFDAGSEELLTLLFTR
jgi:hypothetical protein